MDTSQAIEQAQALLAQARRVTVLSGAGMSTASGIPDYRGPKGLWTRDPDAEKLVTLEYYMGSADIRARSWQMRGESGVLQAQPNAAHRALLALERSGRLHALVTQNIDGLQQLAGSDPSLVVEMHGTVRESICMSCQARMPTTDVLSRIEQGERDPRCTLCQGIIKTATIYFGQSLETAALERADRAARECDVLLTVGTSLAVYPVALMVPTAKRAGAQVIIVNGGPTEMDALANVVVRGDLTEALPQVLAQVS